MTRAKNLGLAIKSNWIAKELRKAIDRRRVNRARKKANRKAKRQQLIYMLREKAGDFMKAAFEPKTSRNLKRRKKKLEGKSSLK